MIVVADEVVVQPPLVGVGPVMLPHGLVRGAVLRVAGVGLVSCAGGELTAGRRLAPDGNCDLLESNPEDIVQ